MAVNPDIETLLALMACPSCRGSFNLESARLICVACGRTFPFEVEVPDLIDRYHVDEASFLARLQYAILRNPRLYDFHQKYGGGRPIAAQVSKELAAVEDATLLDIG